MMSVGKSKKKYHKKEAKDRKKMEQKMARKKLRNKKNKGTANNKSTNENHLKRINIFPEGKCRKRKVIKIRNGQIPFYHDPRRNQQPC